MRLRFDAARGLGFGATPIEVTREGYKVYRGTAAFGDVTLEYGPSDPGGQRTEYVPTAAAMSPEVAATLVGCPFTLHHPDDLLDAADPEVVKRHAEGTVTRSVPDLSKSPPELVVDVKVWTLPAQEAIESGQVRDLSPGYFAKDAPAPAGAHCRGRPYQVVQQARLYNHLSGVLRARGVAPDGRRARLDAETAPYPLTDREASSMTTDTKPQPPAADKDSSKQRSDASPEEVLAKFSPEGAEILKSLPEADMALLLASMAPIAAAAADPMLPAVEVEDATTPAASGALTMDAVQKMIDASLSKMAGAKKSDAAPARPVDNSRLPGNRPVAAAAPHLDADTITARAEKAAEERVRLDAEIVEQVRKDGHEVYTIAGAREKMLSVIKQHTPKAFDRAAADLKAGRLDGVKTAYEVADDVRRTSVLADEIDLIRRVADSEGDGQRADLPRFTLPDGAVNRR